MDHFLALLVRGSFPDAKYYIFYWQGMMGTLPGLGYPLEKRPSPAVASSSRQGAASPFPGDAIKETETLLAGRRSLAPGRSSQWLPNTALPLCACASANPLKLPLLSSSSARQAPRDMMLTEEAGSEARRAEAEAGSPLLRERRGTQQVAGTEPPRSVFHCRSTRPAPEAPPCPTWRVSWVTPVGKMRPGLDWWWGQENPASWRD